jgi:hypothetical protein
VTADDVLARLSAGLDRDEQLARAAAEGWHVNVVDSGEATGAIGGDAYDLLLAHDPARERHEIALKRLILREHVPAKKINYAGPYPRVEIVVCECCSFLAPAATDAEDDYEPWPCDYIQALASIYADPAEENA